MDSISKEQAIDLIRGFNGQENTITFSRAFLRLTGNIPSALMLSELVFWAGRSADPEGWIWKTNHKMQEELCLSRHQVRCARKVLESHGIIETKVKKVAENPTVHYRICERKLAQLLVCIDTANGKF